MTSTTTTTTKGHEGPPRKRLQQKFRPCQQGFLSLLVLSMAAMMQLVEAAPLWLLMNGIPKCLQMTGITGMTYRIEYNAPDLEDENPGTDSKHVGSNAAHAYYEHHRQQFQQSGNMRAPLNLRIMHLGGALKTASGRWSRPTASTYHNRNSENHEIRSPLGSYSFRAERDGTIEICVSSLLARPLSPMPIHLKVVDDFRAEESLKNKAEAAEKEKQLQAGQERAERTLTVMETSVNAMIKKVDLLIGNAEFAQKQELDFHDQTVKMHSATKWWPIGQLVVLLLTGAAQATLIGRSFQKTFR